MAEGVWQARRARYDPHGWDVTRDDDAATTHGTDDTRRPRVHGVLDVDGRAWVAIDGDVIVVDPTEDGVRRSAHRTVRDDLSSPMPATVIAVHVGEGDQVATGDVLVLLEAMKMELPLRAPHAGRVTAVHCTPGALVQPGLVLVTIEETP